MAKFKVGQTVIVYRFIDTIFSPSYNESMISKFLKKSYIISEVINRADTVWYRFKGCGDYIFDESWLKLSNIQKEPIKKIKYPINWVEIINKGYGKI